MIYEIKRSYVLAIPAHINRDLGLSHVRGLILYGAPGTGKSLLARTIGSIMKSSNVGHNANESEIIINMFLLYFYSTLLLLYGIMIEFVSWWKGEPITCRTQKYYLKTITCEGGDL